MSASSADLPLLKSTQVTPLPVGSGGNNTTKQELNKINVQLAMLDSQAMADQKFDPPAPKPVVPSQIKEAFCSGSSWDIPAILSATGVTLIIYGIFSK
jgi:hypothetical protein